MRSAAAKPACNAVKVGDGTPAFWRSLTLAPRQGRAP